MDEKSFSRIQLNLQQESQLNEKNRKEEASEKGKSLKQILKAKNEGH